MVMKEKFQYVNFFNETTFIQTLSINFYFFAIIRHVTIFNSNFNRMLIALIANSA